MRPCHTDTEQGAPPYAGGRVLDTDSAASPPRTSRPIARPASAAGARPISCGRCAGASRPTIRITCRSFPFPYYNRLTDATWPISRRFSTACRRCRGAEPARKRSPALSAARPRRGRGSPQPPLPGPWRADPAKDAAWNRGAYLVATIGRCGECHTPRNWLGAPDPRSLPRRRAAATPAGRPGAEHHPRPESRDRQLEHRRHRHGADRRPDARISTRSAAAWPRSSRTPPADEEDRRAIAVYLQSRAPDVRDRCGRDRSSRLEWRALSGLDGSVATSYDARAPDAAIDRVVARGGRRSGRFGARNGAAAPLSSATGGAARGAGIGARAIREELGPFRPDRAGAVGRRRLGAYQAGAYAALEHSGVRPNWIAGTAIGAINAAIIAGNLPHERVSRLRRFWQELSRRPRAASGWVRAGVRRWLDGRLGTDRLAMRRADAERGRARRR